MIVRRYQLWLAITLSVAAAALLSYALFIVPQVKEAYATLKSGSRHYSNVDSFLIRHNMHIVRPWIERDILAFRQCPPSNMRSEEVWLLGVLTRSAAQKDEDLMWRLASIGYPVQIREDNISSAYYECLRPQIASLFVESLSHLLVRRYGIKEGAAMFFSRIRTNMIAPEIRASYATAEPELLRQNPLQMRKWIECDIESDATVSVLNPFQEQCCHWFLVAGGTEADEFLMWKKARKGYPTGAAGSNKQTSELAQQHLLADTFLQSLSRLLENRHGTEKMTAILSERIRGGNDVAPEIKQAYERWLDKE